MERTFRVNAVPTILIDGRCVGCGRLLMKFAPNTQGLIEIKCWASRCKQINRFNVDTHQTTLVTT